jgi:hypothetical protein
MYLKLRLFLLTLCFVFATIIPSLAGGVGGTISPDLSGTEHLQERMLGDQEIMSLVRSFGSDPEMQALLADPKVLEAVLSGDLGFLLGDPRFRKILDSPKVKDIGRILENRNAVGAH